MNTNSRSKTALENPAFAGRQVRLTAIACKELRHWSDTAVLLATGDSSGRVEFDVAPGPYAVDVDTDNGWRSPEGLEQYVVGGVPSPR